MNQGEKQDKNKGQVKGHLVALRFVAIIAIAYYALVHEQGLVGPCSVMGVQDREQVAVSTSGNTSEAISTTTIPRHPWRFTFMSKDEFDAKRLEGIESLKSHLNSTKDFNGTIRNADDNCVQPFHVRKNKKCMFRHIPRPFVDMGFFVEQGVAKLGSETKTMVNPKLFGKNCVAITAGVWKDSTFEQHLSEICPNVHAFDCTVLPDAPHVKDQKFAFHKVCLGQNDGLKDSDTYVAKTGIDGSDLIFQSLDSKLQELKLDHVDLMKFDVEGSEWQLWPDVLSLPPEQQPIQVMLNCTPKGQIGGRYQSRQSRANDNGRWMNCSSSCWKRGMECWT